MAENEILRGKPGLPLYGKKGTILYATPVEMSCNIVISWDGGKDVDICAYYTHYPDVTMGFGHGTEIDDEKGFTGSWSGDNTSGGPENVSIAYSGAQGLKGKSFEIHANWYRVGTNEDGEEESGGGNATVKATDAKGNEKSFTLMPGTNKGKAATAGDPGCRINFNNDGTIKDITAA